MKKVVECILALQEVDLRIRNLNSRMEAIPVERAKIVKEFRGVCAILDHAKEQVLIIEQAQKKQAALTASLQSTHQSLLIQSTSIKRNTEYQNMMTEINRVKMKISDSETTELELMEKHDAARKAVAEQEKHYNAFGRQAKAEVIQLDKMKEEIATKIKKLEEVAEQRKKFVPMTLYTDYARILSSNRGEPVGKIENNSCPNCGLGLPPQTLVNAKKGDLVKCDSCNYFLYDPNPQE